MTCSRNAGTDETSTPPSPATTICCAIGESPDTNFAMSEVVTVGVGVSVACGTGVLSTTAVSVLLGGGGLTIDVGGSGLSVGTVCALATRHAALSTTIAGSRNSILCEETACWRAIRTPLRPVRCACDLKTLIFILLPRLLFLRILEAWHRCGRTEPSDFSRSGPTRSPRISRSRRAEGELCQVREPATEADVTHRAALAAGTAVLCTLTDPATPGQWENVKVLRLCLTNAQCDRQDPEERRRDHGRGVYRRFLT